MNRESVGNRISELRQARNITQHALAMAAGVSPTYIYQLERGQKSPTVEYLGYICDALGISLSSFFAESDDLLFGRLAMLTEKQKILLNSFLDSLA